MRRRTSPHSGDNRDDWMVAVEALVADVDDPEGMHRIRVVIPAFNESLIHDEWVTALVPWVGQSGYGPVSLPALNSEVLLFGRLGQKHSLFYLSRFNEDFLIPGGFVGGNVRGLKTDGAYKLLADLLIEIISQTQVIVQAESEIDLDAEDVWLRDAGAVSVHGRGNQLGLMGAEPISRRALPDPAHDLSSVILLANAIRSLLIDLGPAE
jgi:hypothetical protein